MYKGVNSLAKLTFIKNLGEKTKNLGLTVLEFYSLVLSEEIRIGRLTAFWGWTVNPHYDEKKEKEARRKLRLNGISEIEYLEKVRIASNFVKGKEFQKYAPLQRAPFKGLRRSLFSILYEKGKEEGVKTRVIDAYHFKITYKNHTSLSSSILREFFKLGYIGAEFQNGVLTYIYLPVLPSFKVEFENEGRKPPRDYWWSQFLKILESKGGITEENLKNISVMDFEPWNGQRIKSKTLAKMRLKARKLFLKDQQ